MTRVTILTSAELIALGAVDGTRTQPPMRPEMWKRLRRLNLIEHRDWPNGPVRRTVRGDRRVREGK